MCEDDVHDRLMQLLKTAKPQAVVTISLPDSNKDIATVVREELSKVFATMEGDLVRVRIADAFYKTVRDRSLNDELGDMLGSDEDWIQILITLMCRWVLTGRWRPTDAGG